MSRFYFSLLSFLFIAISLIFAPKLYAGWTCGTAENICLDNNGNFCIKDPENPLGCSCTMTCTGGGLCSDTELDCAATSGCQLSCDTGGGGSGGGGTTPTPTSAPVCGGGAADACGGGLYCCGGNVCVTTESGGIGCCTSSSPYYYDGVCHSSPPPTSGNCQNSSGQSVAPGGFCHSSCSSTCGQSYDYYCDGATGSCSSQSGPFAAGGACACATSPTPTPIPAPGCTCTGSGSFLGCDGSQVAYCDGCNRATTPCSPGYSCNSTGSPLCVSNTTATPAPGASPTPTPASGGGGEVPPNVSSLQGSACIDNNNDNKCTTWTGGGDSPIGGIDVTVSGKGTYTTDNLFGGWQVLWEPLETNNYTVSIFPKSVADAEYKGLGNGSSTLRTTGTTTVANPSTNNIVDILYSPKFLISGTVYIDLDNDGFQDAGESGYSGATLSIGPGYTATTNASGNYEFKFTAGTYNVTLTIPIGYVLTTPPNPKQVTVSSASPLGTANFGIRQLPPECSSITANPNPVNSGATSFLSAICSGGPIYNWPPPTAGSTSPSDRPNPIFTPPGVCSGTTVTQNLTVTNSAGNSSYTTEITVLPKSDLTGTIWVDTDGNNCSSSATRLGTGGRVTIYDNGVEVGIGNTNASSVYTVSDTTDPCSANRTAVLGGITDYRVLSVRYQGGAWTSSGLSGYTYTLPSNNPPAASRSLDFCITAASPWFQTTTGDVRMGSLQNTVPSGKQAATDATNPSVFYSSQSISDFGSKGGTVSSKNWVVNEEFSYQVDTANRYGTAAYSYYVSRAKKTQVPLKKFSEVGILTCPDSSSDCRITNAPTGVYKVTGPVTITSYTHAVGSHVVLLVDGSVTIASQMKVPSTADNLLIVAAKGSITFDKNLGQNYDSTVTDLEGVFTAEGSINSESIDNGCYSGVPDKRLNIGGVIVANALRPFSESGGGRVVNNRSMCVKDLIYPSLTVQQRLDFIPRLADFYKIPVTKWREINP